MGLNGAFFQRNKIMGSNAINIGWNKYEVALLIDAYFTYQSGDSARKDGTLKEIEGSYERSWHVH